MDPEMIDQIPSNVTARLLPKTLFGEKFVSLVPPQGPSPTPLAAGDVIDEDRCCPPSARPTSRRRSGRSPVRCRAAVTSSAARWSS